MTRIWLIRMQLRYDSRNPVQTIHVDQAVSDDAKADQGGIARFVGPRYLCLG